MHEALPALERTIAERRGARRPSDELHGRSCWPTRRAIGEKVREEAEEVARAAAGESDERVAEEAADVLYHLSVLLASRDLTLADALGCSMSVVAELAGRLDAPRSRRCASWRASTRWSRCATPSSPTARRRSRPT